MLAYMLDTNICIHVVRDRPPELRARFNADADRLCISSVVLSELLYGAAKSAKPDANRRLVEDFAARLDVRPFDDKAAAHAGEIRADLERQRMPIGGYDILIAGHARSRGIVVVTRNTREFRRVDGLRVVDWVGGT